MYPDYEWKAIFFGGALGDNQVQSLFRVLRIRIGEITENPIFGFCRLPADSRKENEPKDKKKACLLQTLATFVRLLWRRCRTRKLIDHFHEESEVEFFLFPLGLFGPCGHFFQNLGIAPKDG
mgnify:CR=1 FL=1